MIEAIGSMATSIGRAVSAPAVGGEIGRAVSFAAPKAAVSGGAFSPGLSTASIFSETRPFVSSAVSVPEMPMAKSADIFSSAWSTLGRVDAPAVSTMPKTDSMRSLGFEPFVAKPITIAEKSISLNKGEWVTLAKSPARTIAEKVFPETKPLMPESSNYEKTVDSNSGLTILAESAHVPIGVEESIIAKTLVAEKKQSEKVVDLLVETGVYTKEKATKRVTEIVAKRGLVEVDTNSETEPEVESKPEPLPVAEASVKKTKVKTKEIQVETETKEKKLEDESLKEKPPEQVPVVDEKAQASRKKEIKEKISSLFGKARRFGLEKISSREITNDLDKNRENRSLLLRQLLYPLLPDGSLEEAVKAVESLGELGDVSKMAEQGVEERVNVIFDTNVPVKLSEEKSKPVTDKDVKRVLKYLQTESIAA